MGALHLHRPWPNVLLASGRLAPVESLHGESVVALCFRTMRLQVAIACVMPADDGESLGLDFGGNFGVFAEGTAQDELPRGSRSCVLPLELLRMLPRDVTGHVLSKGSCSHAAAACVPCKFHCTERGCKDGVLCGLCHFPHPELTRAAKRALVRKAGWLENPLGYKHFVEPAFHRFIEALCSFMTMPQPQSVADFPQIPIFLKNTLLHFSLEDHQFAEAKRPPSLPRRLRAQHEPMYVACVHFCGEAIVASKEPIKVPSAGSPGDCD